MQCLTWYRTTESHWYRLKGCHGLSLVSALVSTMTSEHFWKCTRLMWANGSTNGHMLLSSNCCSGNENQNKLAVRWFVCFISVSQVMLIWQCSNFHSNTMSTSDIIYDKRFLRGTWHGHRVEIPDDKLEQVFVIERDWYYYPVQPRIKRWLLSQGPYSVDRHSFSFARESTAALFKLQYL